jgi:hypothetical protein
MSENQASLRPSSVVCRSGALIMESVPRKAMRESYPERLLPLVRGVEAALFLRWQEMMDESGQTHERAAMRAACDDLWTIRIHKLGGPVLPQGKTK